MIMKETKQLMSLSDVSEKEMQELYEWGKKWGQNEATMRKLLEQSLAVGNNLDYLHSQMEHWEAWCKENPRWKEDPYRKGKILRPIVNFPLSHGQKQQDTTTKKNK